MSYYDSVVPDMSLDRLSELKVSVPAAQQSKELHRPAVRATQPSLDAALQSSLGTGGVAGQPCLDEGALDEGASPAQCWSMPCCSGVAPQLSTAVQSSVGAEAVAGQSTLDVGALDEAASPGQCSSMPSCSGVAPRSMVYSMATPPSSQAFHYIGEDCALTDSWSGQVWCER